MAGAPVRPGIYLSSKGKFLALEGKQRMSGVTSLPSGIARAL
jgi:hypothetical protein